MKQLTEKQKKKYFDDPNRCPACALRLHLVKRDQWEDSNFIWVEWKCENCDTFFTEEYKLSDVFLEDVE